MIAPGQEVMKGVLEAFYELILWRVGLVKARAACWCQWWGCTNNSSLLETLPRGVKVPVFVGDIISFLSLCALSRFSRVWFWDPVDCSPPGFSVHGVLQAGTLGWVASSSSRVIFPTRGSNLRLLTSPASTGGFFRGNSTWEAWCSTHCWQRGALPSLEVMPQSLQRPLRWATEAPCPDGTLRDSPLNPRVWVCISRAPAGPAGASHLPLP